MNRRDFLHASAAGLALPAVAAERKPPRVGLIGCGWYGKCDLFRLIQVAPVEVVSLCDVDKQDARRGRRHGRRAAGVEEEAAHLRRLPRDAQGEGPRHRPRRHARPLARPADDRRRRGRGRRLRAEADQRGRGRGPGDGRRRPQAQARRAGRHAAAQHAAPDRGPRHASSRRASSARSAWSRSTATTTCAPATTRRTPTPPDYLDYEMWTGPAPMRPYNALVHPRGWRAFMEYGNGIVGDMCIHMLDMVRWMLGLGWPKRDLARPAASSSTRRARRTSPTRRRPPSTSATCKSSGSTAPGATPADPKYPWGATLLRRQGHAQGERQRATTSSRWARASRSTSDVDVRAGASTPRTRPRRTWRSTSPRPSAATCRTSWRRSPSRGKPVADIEEGHISTASCILANLSMQLGRTLTWDAEKQQVVGDDEANKLLRRPYRKPWVHPAG